MRRRRESFRDLDVIATATDPAALTAFFTTLPGVLEVVAHGDTKATVVTQQGLRLDLRVVPPECFGDLLQHFTGSKEHNIALREEAVRRGLSISEYGVTVAETGEVKAFATEEELYGFLGYQFVPPELRENAGELDAARQGELPALVELGRPARRAALPQHVVLRTARTASRRWPSRPGPVATGTSSSPTTRTTCATAGCRRSGRRSPPSTSDCARSACSAGSRPTSASTGRSTSPDDELAELDWVVASLHTSFDRSPTERVLAAIDNPHVDCIGHLTGRRLSRPQRAKGAPIDVELVVARAAETGTALEINSQPDRLDLRDVHARLAGEAGVLVPVNTDAHSTKALAYAELGVAQARRGWLTKEQVLNTRTWAQIAKLTR